MSGAARAHDVVVVGAGPNGLSAAIVLARAGLDVLVLEADQRPGGGARSDALTLPGFLHDVCSTVHPLGAASPFFRSIELERYGVRWLQPPAAVAHQLTDGRVVTLERSLDETVRRLGRDGDTYRALVSPFVERFERWIGMVLGPLRWPSDPLLLARFGLRALPSMKALATRFTGPEAPALLGGIAAHATLPLSSLGTSAFALVLGVSGHAVGWPIARQGSQTISDALVACLRAHGGEVATGRTVQTWTDLPPARAYVFDLTPKQLLTIAGERLSRPFQRRLRRFRYGPGVFKLDWALTAPIPWSNPECARSATVHLSGDLTQIAASEALVHHGQLATRPFTLVVQPTLFDDTRAPAGQHVAWAYCHVPNGAAIDAGSHIERHIEQFAPGFRDLISARVLRGPADLEAYDANYVGGDISGGVSDLGQLFFRPVARLDPYSTPAKNIFICSSSTPPGGGVHGMCGYWAARSVLARAFGRQGERLEWRHLKHEGA